MQPQTEWEALSQLVQQDRRNGKRLPLTFPIEVSGLDHAGKLFVEQTTTADVSETGCRFQLKTRIKRGKAVAIRLLTRLSPAPDANRPVLFEIAWAEEVKGECLVGARKLQPDKLWHMNFPPSEEPAPKF